MKILSDEEALRRRRQVTKDWKEKNHQNGKCWCGRVLENPDKYTCEKCLNKVKESAARKRSTPEGVQEDKDRGMKARKEVRLQAILAYGGFCSCCGESEMDFLALDHVNNDGTFDRDSKGRRKGGEKIYRKLRRENYPPGYQILCSNCNWSKHLNKGECIHNIKAREFLKTGNIS